MILRRDCNSCKRMQVIAINQAAHMSSAATAEGETGCSWRSLLSRRTQAREHCTGSSRQSNIAHSCLMNRRSQFCIATRVLCGGVLILVIITGRIIAAVQPPHVCPNKTKLSLTNRARERTGGKTFRRLAEFSFPLSAF